MTSRHPLALARTLFLVACATALVAPRVSRAQDAVTPEVVAARVQAFYAGTTTMRLEFQQDYWSDAYRRTTTSRGRLSIARPGRIRFDYAPPSGLIIVGDGDRFTSYEPGDHDGPGQFSTGESDAAALGLGFLTGSARLDPATYTFRFAAPDATPAPRTCAGHCDVLVLTPRTPSPLYAEIRLHVSNAPGAEGVVHRVTIIDHERDWNAFTFLERDFSTPIPDSTFEFTPPPGAREVGPPGR